MSTTSLIQVVLRHCIGIRGRQNDVLFTGSSGPATANVIYFGGDIQDLHEHMNTYEEGQQFIEWDLESTARILHHRFSVAHKLAHIWVIRPNEWIANAFASYSNLIDVNDVGNPVFPIKEPQQLRVWEHLCALLESAKTQLNSQFPKTMVLDFERLPVYLIGFSKGCGVVTHCLYQLAYFESSCSNSPHLHPILSNLHSIYWLDAGHSAVDQQWPVDEKYLSLLKAEKCPHLFAYATPYQVGDTARPWKRRDYKSFIKLMSTYKLPHRHSILLQNENDQERDLRTHFSILNNFPIE